MPEPTCATCECFKPNTGPFNPAAYGMCRRFPNAVVDKHKDDWCAEFRPVKIKSTKLKEPAS